MEAVYEFIQMNVQFAPFAIFGLLILAGFNIPVSEDLMLYISGVLAAKNPEYLPHLFAGVFLGAYLSDLICYAFMGRYLGEKIFQIKFFSKLISRKKLRMIGRFYENYGVLTLVIGRFIPFGVRNGLFFTAGLTKMNPLKFALADLVACLSSNIIFFWIYYNYGELALDHVKEFNIIFFCLAVIFFSYKFITWRMNKKASKKSNAS